MMETIIEFFIKFLMYLIDHIYQSTKKNSTDKKSSGDDLDISKEIKKINDTKQDIYQKRKSLEYSPEESSELMKGLGTKLEEIESALYEKRSNLLREEIMSKRRRE